MLGPFTHSSPTMPAATVAPSASTILACACSASLPQDPALREASSGASRMQHGLVSVIPNPCISVAPRPSQVLRSGTGIGAPPTPATCRREKSVAANAGCCAMN